MSAFSGERRSLFVLTRREARTVVLSRFRNLTETSTRSPETRALASAEKYNKDHDIHSRPIDELMNHGEINHEHKMSRTPRTSMDNGRRGSIDESHARRSIDLSTQKSLGGKLYAVDVNVNRDMENKMVSGLI